jgi:hypothetical protein
MASSAPSGSFVNQPCGEGNQTGVAVIQLWLLRRDHTMTAICAAPAAAITKPKKPIHAWPAVSPKAAQDLHYVGTHIALETLVCHLVLTRLHEVSELG